MDNVPVRNGTASALNEYKLIFLKRRWLQTLLGGVDPLVKGSIPPTVYIFQVFLFLVPGILATVWTIIAQYNILETWISQIICGVVFILGTQLVSARIRSKIGVMKDPGATLFAEDDEYFFDELLSGECMNYVLPPKANWLHCILQVIFSGVNVGLAVGYLLPKHIAGGAIIICILGWLVVCSAQYSLTSKAPPEPNMFRAQDPLGITTYFRPLYLFMFYIVDLAQPSTDIFLGICSICHADRFPIFPFTLEFWMASTDRRADSLAFRADHRVHLGGTTSLTDRRLFIHFGLALISPILTFLLGWFADPSAGIAFASGLGYLLSRNLLPLHTEKTKGATVLRFLHLSFWHRLILDGIASLAYGALGFVLARTAYGKSSVQVPLQVVITLGWVLGAVSVELQKPFLLNVIRSPFFGKEMGPIRRGFHGVLGALYYGLITLLPILNLVYLAIFFPELHRTNENMTLYIVYSVLVARELRWIWQSGSRASLELLVVFWVFQGVGSGNQLVGHDGAPEWALCLFIASLAHHRLRDLLGKLYYMTVSFYTVMTQKKLRFDYMGIILSVEVILFPLVLASLILSTILSAPLIPLLGLPIFVMSFPRPSRQSPMAGSSYSANKDTPFYQQLMPRVVEALPNKLSTGFFGEANEGSYFLMRFESRIVWMEILEKGYGYFVVVLKGLELQETSCHHVEAGKVDDVFAHSSVGNDAAISTTTFTNHYLFHTLSSIGKLGIRTHTKSRISMVGIVDSPETLKLQSSTFYKTLLWVLIKNMPDTFPQSWSNVSLHYRDSDEKEKFPQDWYSFLQAEKQKPQLQLNSDNIVSLARACFTVVEVFGLGGLSTVIAGPRHIFEVFQGSIPSSLESGWLEKDVKLKSLVIQAYRMAYKIVFDQASLGPFSDSEELKEALEELDSTWYVGSYDDDQWDQQILQEKENLFSLEFTEGVYFANILRMDDNVLQVGQLNKETIQGIWASLNTELLYVTNDDDERYSIQAHSTFLRNITIQSSEPPLGYPAYASQFIAS